MSKFEFTQEDLGLMIQWYCAVQDLNPGYFDSAGFQDSELYRRITASVSVPLPAGYERHDPATGARPPRDAVVDVILRDGREVRGVHASSLAWDRGIVGFRYWFAPAPLAPLRAPDIPESPAPETPPDKYHREIRPGVWADVYDVLRAWDVRNPALQHLIKKALQPGARGHKTLRQDLDDIVLSARRARDLTPDAG